MLPRICLRLVMRCLLIAQLRPGRQTMEYLTQAVADRSRRFIGGGEKLDQSNFRRCEGGKSLSSSISRGRVFAEDAFGVPLRYVDGRGCSMILCSSSLLSCACRNSSTFGSSGAQDFRISFA